MPGLHLIHRFRVGNEKMHRFGLETKGTHSIHFFGPNSDVLVHFGHFRYYAENHGGVAFNAPVRTRNERNASNPLF
jgi:hypothetical protein